MRRRNTTLNSRLSPVFVVLLLGAGGFLGIEKTSAELNPGIGGPNWRGPATQFDAELGWAPIPHYRATEEGKSIHLNSLGFRSQEIDPDKEQIVLLGDSVVWGYQLGDAQTVSSYLNRIYLPSVQVVNLAVNGYGVDQYYLYLKRHLGRFKRLKKVVLVICTANDLEDTASNARYGTRKPLFIYQRGSLQLDPRPIRKYSLINLFYRNPIIRRQFELYPSFKPYLDFVIGEKKLPPPEVEKIVGLLFERMETLITEAGARLTVVISPSRADFIEPSASLVWFQNFLAARQVDTINLFDIFMKFKPEELDPIYLDNMHYSTQGHRAVAEVLHRYLQ